MCSDDVYKQWLILTYLKTPVDFSLASILLQYSVTKATTANILSKLYKREFNKSIKLWQRK